MRRSLADAILRACDSHAPAYQTAGMANDDTVTFPVTFRLGDLRSLRRTIESVGRLTKPAKHDGEDSAA